MLIEELKMRSNQLHYKLKSLYLGGGSPNELSFKHLDTLLDYLHSNYDLSETEKTIELNPTPFIPNLLVSFFNRHSMGIQSFSMEDLKIIGRSYQIDLREIEKWRNFSSNLSFDMIYDIPHSPLKRLKENITILNKLEPDHLSWYSLELDNLGIANQMPRYQKNNPEEEFSLIKNSLKSKGFTSYEISNFAKEGRQSIHNLGYWNRESYLGIGPGAVGTEYGTSVTRYFNHTDLPHYLSNLKKGIFPEKNREILSDTQSINEFIMLSLRQIKGMDLNLFEKTSGLKFLEIHKTNIDKHQNYLNQKEDLLSLNDQGMLFFNTICSDFFLED